MVKDWQCREGGLFLLAFPDSNETA